MIFEYFLFCPVFGKCRYLDLNSSGYEGEGSSPDMRGIFVARGPRFAKGGKVVQWIKLVDQYQVRKCS